MHSFSQSAHPLTRGGAPPPARPLPHLVLQSSLGSVKPTHQVPLNSSSMPSAKPQILISGALVWASAEVEQLSEHYEFLRLDSPDRATFLKELTSGKYSQLSAIYRHNSSADAVGIYDEEIISALPSTVQYLCHNGAGELRALWRRRRS